MKDALLVYVRWERVLPWKVLSLPERETDKFVPVGFGSNQPVFRSRAVPGTLLYVVTLPRLELSNGEVRLYAPTLVARIRVAAPDPSAARPAYWQKGLARLREQWCVVAESDPGASEFYELNDATAALAQLGCAVSPEQPLQVQRRELGKALRFIRGCPGGADPAEAAFAPCVRQAQQESVFMSYTHAGGRAGRGGQAFALDLATGLLGKGFSPWFDALTIPRYDTAREKDGTPARLERLIERGIKQSSLAICVVTDDYTNKDEPQSFSWTREEWAQIVARGQTAEAFRFVFVVRGGTDLTDLGFAADALGNPARVFPDTTPAALAGQIQEWWQADRVKLGREPSSVRMPSGASASTGVAVDEPSGRRRLRPPRRRRLNEASVQPVGGPRAQRGDPPQTSPVEAP